MRHSSFFNLQAKRPRTLKEGYSDTARSRGSMSERRGASSDAVQASAQEPRAADTYNQPSFVRTENFGIHLQRRITLDKKSMHN
jgi:hypothetical protein